MRSIQRFLLVLGLIGVCLGWLGNTTPAFACSCAEATQAEQFENATAVFFGKVTNISQDGGSRSVDFDVSKSQKGSVAENVTVLTGWGDADCGFNFEVGREYAVYAYGEEGRLGTNICTGTSLVAESQDNNSQVDIVANPEIPTESFLVDGADNPILVLIVIVALASFGAGALLMYFVGRKNTK